MSTIRPFTERVKRHYGSNDYIENENQNWVSIIQQLKPAKPLYILFPQLITQNARAFAQAFPGKALYAVKTNPDPNAIKAIIAGGIKSFDVASLEEIRLVHSLCPQAEMHFMHPIKTPEDIRSAYFDYGIRHFVLDHEDELYKIMRETDLAQDLHLTVRIACPKNDSALIDFSSKFGANREDAIMLLQHCRSVSKTLGISFHVGTQTTQSARYAMAIHYSAAIIRESGINIDSINIGGGYPVAYQGDKNIPTHKDCIDAALQALKEEQLEDLNLLAEPGRALVANGAKLVTRVELRKDDMLYINDGVYGGLFDAAKWVDTLFPTTAISCDRPFDGDTTPYRLSGPTCDSLDMMNGPFTLPSDIDMGDWIVFDNVGAYSQAIRGNFNGFGHADVICI